MAPWKSAPELEELESFLGAGNQVLACLTIQAALRRRLDGRAASTELTARALVRQVLEAAVVELDDELVAAVAMTPEQLFFKNLDTG
eukprot:6458728-Prymnesium_polylepis.2